MSPRAGRCAHARLLPALLVWAHRLAAGAFTPCDSGHSPLAIDGIEIVPALPRTGQEVSVQVLGHLVDAFQGQINPDNITVSANVEICRRLDDCMPVYTYEASFCELAAHLGTPAPCGVLNGSAPFKLQQAWTVPLTVLRGSYALQVQLRDPSGEALACYQVSEVEVLASSPFDRLRDLRDAVVAFAVAASASKALGGNFPSLTQGAVPQISGFLCIGVVVGPYCTNLVSHMHIFLIGGFINKFSLAFIGGAAGAEIFLPEFRHILGTLSLQLVGIFFCTIVACGIGLSLMTTFGILPVPALTMQPTFAARVAVGILAGTLMATSAPASTIAVVAELKCGHTLAGKMALGLTVMQDILVLALFSICCQLIRITTQGGQFGIDALVQSLVSIGFSVLLGFVVGQFMRLLLPVDTRNGPHGSVKEMAEVANPVREMLVEEDAPCEEESGMTCTGLRGLAVLAVLFGAFNVAECMSEWTDGRIHGEPLLACVVTSCITGHDEGRRAHLLKALSFWCPHVLLPFFTLAGASLNLTAMIVVFPAALALLVLRGVGIACGSLGAAFATSLLAPEARTTAKMAGYMWTTVVAQAGITIGLVLQVSSQPDFKKWSGHFSSWILGVVVMNQVLGPMMCKVGLRQAIKFEVEAKQRSVAGDSEESWDGNTEESLADDGDFEQQSGQGGLSKRAVGSSSQKLLGATSIGA